MRPSSFTASRSSASSATRRVDARRGRSRRCRGPCTIDHSPSSHVAGNAGDQPFGHAVGAVGRHGHAHPVAARGAERPVAHVVDGGVGRRRRARQAASLDDRRAALLHGRDEVVLEPCLVARRARPRSCPPTSQWKRSGYCVAEWLPQIVIFLMSVTCTSSLRGELGDGPVVVEPGHRGEPRRVDLRGVVHGDQAVGVGRVADHEDLDVARRAVGQRLALPREDLAVGRQQVGALHPRLAGHGRRRAGRSWRRRTRCSGRRSARRPRAAGTRSPRAPCDAARARRGRA